MNTDMTPTVKSEADERMRTILDASSRAVIMFDYDNNVVYYNPAAYELMGFESKKALMTGFLEHVIKHTPEYTSSGQLSVSVADRLAAAKEAGHERFETELNTEGMLRFFDVEMKKIPYENNFAIVVYIIEVTGIRERERELIHARELNELQLAKLDLVIKATKIALWDMVIEKGRPMNDNNTIIWSEEFRNMLGFTDENDFPNLVGSLQSRIHPDDKDRVMDALVLHLSDKTGKTPYDEEFRVLKKNSEYTYVWATGESIRDKEGNPLRVAGSVMDISEEKKKLLDNELQLAKLHLVVQATKIVLWEMEVEAGDPDPLSDSKPFIWSDDFRRQLGYMDENDFPNLVGSFHDRLHPDDRERNISMFKKHLMDKTGQSPYDIEVRILKKNGEYAYYHSSGESIRDEDGNPIRVVGAFIDISETKELIFEAERQRKEAVAANKAKSAFLSTMSHEIRTPMNAILGITEIQLQNEALDALTKEALEKIYTSGDLLLSIINDILDLSKIEADKLELTNEKYEIASLISDTAQLNMMRIGSSPIEFELHVDENVPVHLVGDELRVKQILNNLLSNAFKYTAEGFVKLAVKAEECESDDTKTTIIFEVSDTGQGMTKEQIDAIFDEYARFNLATNRATEGTGLGMSITRKLLRLMKGDISVESAPGKGSTFTVHIPQENCGSGTLGPEMAKNLREFRTRSRAHMKRVQISREPMPYGSVLVVDDVETNIYVAKGLLTPYGLKIDSAGSGFAAIEKIKSGIEYDIIFMDHMMPQMDGVETTGILRGMGYTQPIVALTANAVSGQAAAFLGNGFDDFISKPIDVRQLNTVLNRLIRDKQPPEVIEAIRQQMAAEKTNKTGDSEKTPQSGINPFAAEVFARDAKKVLGALDEFIEKGEPYDDSDLRTYMIYVHGIRGALLNIGEKELSVTALRLEQSGRAGNTAVITSETPAFISSLRAFLEDILPPEETPDADADDGITEDIPLLLNKLALIRAACEEYDEYTADEALLELRNNALSHPTKELLRTISELLLHSDFEEIVDAVDKFIAEKTTE